MPRLKPKKKSSKPRGKRTNPLKLDPTRTATLRRSFATVIKRKFARLKLELRKLIVEQDAFGLEDRQIGLGFNVFCPTGEGGGIDPTCSPSGGGKSTEELASSITLEKPKGKVDIVLQKLKSIGAKAAVAEHVVKEGIHYGMSKLPEPVQDSITWSLATAFTGWTASQALAEAIAIERGMSVDQAKTFRAALAATDIISYKPASIGIAAIDSTALALSWVIPPATGVYLAYSAARNPIKTAKAAGKLVKNKVVGAAKAIKRKLHGEGPLVGVNISNHNAYITDDALKRHNYDDWYLALLCSSLDETGSWEEAIEVSRHIYEENPTEPIEVGEEVINAFCPTGPGGGIDPTCSPSGSSGKSEGTKSEGGKNSDGSITSKLSSIAKLAKGVSAAVTSKISKKVKEKYTKLEKRYGSKYAKAIVASAIAGLSLPVPGSSFITAAPVIAIAEMHKYLTSNQLEIITNKRQSSMTDDDIEEAAKELLKELGEELEDLTDNAFCPTGKGGGIDPTCSPDEGGFGGGGGSSKSADEVLAKARKTKDPAKRQKLMDEWMELQKIPQRKSVEPSQSKQSDQPKSSTVSKEQAIEKLRQHIGASAKDPDPLKTAQFDLKPHAATVAKITDMVKAHEATRAFTRVTISQIADKLPGVNIDTLHGILGKMHHDGTIRLGPYTQGLGTHDKPEDLLPLEREAKYYIGMGTTKNSLTANDVWRFNTSAEKIKLFQQWLRNTLGNLVTGKSNEQLWRTYIQQGYNKGLSRSFDDVTRAERVLAIGKGQSRIDFYQGTKDRFLRSAFNQPVSVEKVQLLAGRTFDDLEGVTADMGLRMSRTLTDGLIQGKGARELAKDLTVDLDLGKSRALTIARTEIIRAHAEGQLEAMEQLGVEEVGVAVEWVTAGDDKVCPLCEELEGVVLRLDEARGMLPRHPNCRCAWIPANVGESSKGQKDDLASISRAIKESRGLGEEEDIRRGGAWGPGAEIAESRPESVLNQEQRGILGGFSDYLWNVYCPTGPGGGIDPTCKAGGTAATLPNHPITGIMRWMGKKGYSVSQAVKVLKHYGHTPNISTLRTQLNAGKRGLRGLPANIPDALSTEFDNILLGKASPAAGGTPSSTSSSSTSTPSTPKAPSLPKIPYKDEHNWDVGKEEPAELNGIPFAKAPAKFWEKEKDVDVKEPAPLQKISRVGVMIKEDDGRVWIVQPTNQFGNRKYTMPGGGVELGLSNQQNALKEIWEETGLQVKITGHLGDFKDSNNGNIGRLYVGKRVGGAPWDAKVESFIIDSRTGKPAAESSAVTLVTPAKAAQLLHRTDDLAQLMTVHPISINHPVDGKGSEPLKKFVEGIAPKARDYDAKQSAKGLSYGAGNGELNAVQDIRGFNGLPAVVSKADMNSLIQQGTHIEMLRGIKDVTTMSKTITAAELAEAFRTGEHFPGHGIFGSGTYADSNKGFSNVSLSYAGSRGEVIRMALPKDAKIITVSELEKSVPSAPAGFKGYGSKGGKPREECWRGVQAALAGYDAIYADGKSRSHYSYGKGFYVILNREKLVVQKQNARGHII